MKIEKEQIKEDAEKEAIELFMIAKKIYKEQTEEYIRHFTPRETR